jgi:hypothetical protein
MATIEEINNSLENVNVVLLAADAVIKNPKNDLKTELLKLNSGKRLAPIYESTGAAGLVAATGAAGISSGISSALAGFGAATGAAAATGPVGWSIGAAIVLLGGYAIYKKYKKTQKAKQKKERLINEIICKQQAIISKLQRELNLMQQEIKNLKDTLAVFEELVRNLSEAA